MFNSIILQNESEFVLNESGKLMIEPYVEELPELFVSYFKEILMVGHRIPRLEYYMSQSKWIFTKLFFFSNASEVTSFYHHLYTPKKNQPTI